MLQAIQGPTNKIGVMHVISAVSKKKSQQVSNLKFVFLLTSTKHTAFNKQKNIGQSDGYYVQWPSTAMSKATGSDLNPLFLWVNGPAIPRHPLGPLSTVSAIQTTDSN